MKKTLCTIFCVLIILELCACGRQEETAESENRLETDQVAVAEFRQMKLPITLEALEQCTTNGKWFYISRQKFGPEGTTYQILRGKIEDIYEGEVYLSREKAICLALVADRESNCYALWKEENGVSLEKYDESGELLWHVDQDTQKWAGIGRNNSVSDLSIAGGIVTTDGRLALYTHGTDTFVALFDENGNLLQMTTPEPECLDGIVAGRENHVYGYCITGEDDPVLRDIENPGQCYVLPFKPLNVFSGQEEGIYLSTSEGLWIYDPQTGQTELKWRWADEYMNVDYQNLQTVFCGNEEWYLLCSYGYSNYLRTTDKVTIVSVRNEKRKDHGQKETLTLGYVSNSNEHFLEMLVNLYNRQSKKYYVILAAYGDEQDEKTVRLDAFRLQLLRGGGPDLMEVGSIDARSLADKGVFLDLSEYYTKSQNVSGESILDVVWDGMQYREQNMLVIPSFTLFAQVCKEPIAAEEWTPEKLFQLAEEQEALWYYGTPTDYLFMESMGLDNEYGHYIDYEERKSHFDCPDFRFILENCMRLGGETGDLSTLITNSYELPAFLYSYSLHDVADYLWYCKTLKGANGSWVGSPSWNGARYLMIPQHVLAINQESEKKDGAWDFLQYILSEECQNEIDWAFPVRKDSFERYLKTSYPNKEDDARMQAEFHYSMDYFDPTEEDFDHIRYMVDHSIINKAGGTIKSILFEEAGMYFAGDATLDETIKKIDNRVTLYLNE